MKILKTQLNSNCVFLFINFKSRSGSLDLYHFQTKLHKKISERHPAIFQKYCVVGVVEQDADN